MAKGKSSKGTKYVSKGERRNIQSSVTKAVKLSRTMGENMIHLVDSYMKDQNPWITVPNPNTNETNKRIIRVRVNELWGNSKDNFYLIGKGAR